MQLHLRNYLGIFLDQIHFFFTWGGVCLTLFSVLNDDFLVFRAGSSQFFSTLNL